MGAFTFTFTFTFTGDRHTPYKGSAMTEVHTDFEQAFRDGARLVDGDGNLHTMSVHRMGELAITSGAIGVGDAFTGLSRAVPPSGMIQKGSHPVELSLVRYEADGVCQRGDVRIAAARIVLLGAEVASWVEADVGAGVDSGTCAFVDGDFESDWAPTEDESEPLLDEIGDESSSLGPSANAVHRKVGTRDVFAFSSGLGDGIYTAYWGMDAAGAPAVFCLDFDLLVCPVTVDVELDWPLKRGSLKLEELEPLSVRARVPVLKPGRVEVECDGKIHSFARWRLPDGNLRHVPAEMLGKGRIRFDMRERPEGATPLLRVVTGQRAMRVADE